MPVFIKWFRWALSILYAKHYKADVQENWHLTVFWQGYQFSSWPPAYGVWHESDESHGSYTSLDGSYLFALHPNYPQPSYCGFSGTKCTDWFNDQACLRPHNFRVFPTTFTMFFFYCNTNYLCGTSPCNLCHLNFVVKPFLLNLSYLIHVPSVKHLSYFTLKCFKFHPLLREFTK